MQESLLKFFRLCGHDQGLLLLAHALSVSLEPIRPDQVNQIINSNMSYGAVSRDCCLIRAYFQNKITSCEKIILKFVGMANSH